MVLLGSPWPSSAATGKYVSYGSASLCMSLLHNVFLLYHIDIFVSYYRMDQRAFWWGEAVFLVWNSLNDFVCGWVSDGSLLSASTAVRVSRDTTLRRIGSIKYGGPGLAAAFVLVWYQWAPPQYQFVLSLCLYDGFLTYLDLNHSALLADLATSDLDRTNLSMYASICSAAGSISVFFSFAIWDKENIQPFRVFCVGLAAVSLLGFQISSQRLKKHFVNDKKELAPVDRPHPLALHAQPLSLRRFVTQVMQSNNFRMFAALNLVQVFHCHFNSNFFPLLLEVLLGDHLSPWWQSTLLGFSFTMPHFNNIVFSAFVKSHGTYVVIRGLLLCKVLLAGIMYVAGSGNVPILILFVASNRIFTEGTCKLLNLVISDLVDEDYVVNRRPQAVSALVFGTCALLSKPGQTLAPVVGTYIVSRQLNGFLFSDEPQHRAEDVLLKKQVVFQLVLAVTFLCGACQLLAWSRYTLHGRALEKIKERLTSRAYASHIVV